MIISASRRTDIPAFFSDWFLERIKERNVVVKNPFNPNQIKSISMDPADVDCIVFWTKDPKEMLTKLDKLTDYNYYFLFTLNPYDQQLEKNVPNKNEVLDTFKRLSSELGPERIIWRYDPIFLTDEINEEYHLRQFLYFSEQLKSYTSKCIISFIDFYTKLNSRFMKYNIRQVDDQSKIRLSCLFRDIAKQSNISIEMCAEDMDVEAMAIKRSKCIDADLITKITGKELNNKRDKNQRELCGCASAIDIGTYGTCGHGCVYCYANHGGK